MLRIYCPHVLPIMDYCDILYVGAKVEVLEILQRLQNKCLKTCMGMHILTATQLVHAEPQLSTLDNRRKYHVKMYGFKRAQNSKFLETKTRTTRLSTAPLLKYQKLNSTSYSNSPEVLWAQSRNSLKADVRNIKSNEEFKILAKKILKGTIPAIKDTGIDYDCEKLFLLSIFCFNGGDTIFKTYNMKECCLAFFKRNVIS